MTPRMTKTTVTALFTLALLAGLPAPAWAEDTLDSGNTAWMLVSTVLVLFMTIPGLALFYGGLVRTKNVLSVLMQCFAICCMMSILWLVVGYSLAFDAGAGFLGGKFVGGISNLFLLNLTRANVSGTIPESVFTMFQLTFAIITPALIVGAFAERMKFSAVLWFMSLWLVFVYAPVCHWVWGGGWLGSLGALDFAGGTVVHINAGIAALVACVLLGKRKGYPTTAMLPHSMVLTVIGASMLWVGWFGFNAGSQLAADGVAGFAMLVTHMATAAAALSWMFVEWWKHGKPSALGIATGAVAGLVAITPASGFVGPLGALVIGIASGVLCFYCATTMKRALGYDDSLDVFGVHGIGGMVGAILTGVFASTALGGNKEIDIATQLGIQIVSVVATLVYSGVLSFVLLKIVDGIVGLRVSEEGENVGLDITLHDERGYNY